MGDEQVMMRSRPPPPPLRPEGDIPDLGIVEGLQLATRLTGPGASEEELDLAARSIALMPEAQRALLETVPDDAGELVVEQPNEPSRAVRTLARTTNEDIEREREEREVAERAAVATRLGPDASAVAQTSEFAALQALPIAQRLAYLQNTRPPTARVATTAGLASRVTSGALTIAKVELIKSAVRATGVEIVRAVAAGQTPDLANIVSGTIAFGSVAGTRVVREGAVHFGIMAAQPTSERIIQGVAAVGGSVLGFGAASVAAAAGSASRILSNFLPDGA